MYGRRTLTWSSGGIIWDQAANGMIHFLDISSNGDIICDITTPWGQLVTFEIFSPGQCRLYTQSLNGPFREHTYTVKLVSSNATNKTADIQVLSCAFKSDLLQVGGINKLSATNDIPDTAIPSSVLHYNYKITNNSATNISVRYILATNVGSSPMVYTTSSPNCSLPLPPISNTSKKCWYDDWLSGTSCQAMTIGAGIANVPIVSGSVTMPSSGIEYFTLGIFVEVANYWGSGKNEWVMPAGFQNGQIKSVTASSCAGVICEDGCIGNDLYGQHCNPSTGLCVPNASPKEVNSLKCMATHVLDIGVLPYSWYTPSSALSSMTTKLIAINGALLNLFTSITDYQYLGVDTFQDGNDVVIRIYLKKLSTISSMDIMTLIAWTPLIIVVGAIILAIGPIVYYKLRDWIYKNILSIRTYTAGEVNQIIWGGGEFGDGIVKIQLDDCNTNFGSDAAGLKNCYKSVMCGAADGSVDSLGLPTSVDCTHQQVNQNIDACYTQYLVDHDLVKFKDCVLKVKTDTGSKLQAEADKKSEGGGAGFLLLGLVGIAILGISTVKSGGTITVKTGK
jgi:hypothetical protein